MNEQIKELIQDTVLEMISGSSSEDKIEKLAHKHRNKVHFIPLRYRIFSGILQSLNIKFGNFIEQLMWNIVNIDEDVDIMPESGEKIRLYFTPETDSLIDTYITERQLPGSPDDCTPLFDALLKDIIQVEKHSTDAQRQGITKDVDSLFRTQDGKLIFTEVKYNDDHDTGKFADINRKFIKTWAGLAVYFDISDADELMPIIYYFNPTKRYGPIHTPSRNIMRGSQLFDEFLNTKYEEVDQYLIEISDNPEILAIFDDVYDRVRNGVIL